MAGSTGTMIDFISVIQIDLLSYLLSVMMMMNVLVIE